MAKKLTVKELEAARKAINKDEEEEKKAKARVTTPAALSNISNAVIKAAGGKTSAPSSAMPVVKPAATTTPVPQTVLPKVNSLGLLNPEIVNKYLQQGMAYAKQGPQSRMDIFNSLTGFDIGDYAKGDVNSLDYDISREMSKRNKYFMDQHRKQGTFDFPEFLAAGKIYGPSTDYLTKQGAAALSALEDSKKKDEEAKAARDAQSVTDTWLQNQYQLLWSNRDKTDVLENLQNWTYFDWLSGDRTNPYDFGAIMDSTNNMSDDEYSAWVNNLHANYDNADWEALTNATARNYESQTPALQAQYDLISGELTRRNRIEELEAMADSNPNYAEWSVYQEPDVVLDPMWKDGGAHALVAGLAAREERWGNKQNFINNWHQYQLTGGYEGVDNTLPGKIADFFQGITGFIGGDETLGEISTTIGSYIAAGFQYMSPEQVKRYNVLYEMGPEYAEEYLELIGPGLLAQKAAVEAEYYATRAQNLGTSIWDNAVGFAKKPWGAFNTMLGALSGETDQNAQIYGPARQVNVTREATGEALAELSPFDVFGVPVTKAGYDIFTSIGDMLVANKIGTFAGSLTGKADAAQKVMNFVMSSGAGTDTYLSDLQNGQDPMYAAFHGMAIGGIEAWSESGFIDSLFSPEGKFIARVAKSAGSEGLEEIVSEGGGMAVDLFMSFLTGQENEIEKTYAYYVATLGKDKAALATLQHYANNFALAATSGALIGGGTSAVVNTGEYLDTRSYGKGIVNNGDVDTIMNIGQSMPENSESKRIFDEITGKQGKGKKPSFYQFGQLTKAIVKDLGAEHADIINRVQDEAIAGRLQELGDDAETAKKNAPIIRKVYRGEKLTMDERAAVRWNDRADKVTKELIRENNYTGDQPVPIKWVKGMKETQASESADVIGKQLQVQVATVTPIGKAANRAEEAAKKRVPKRDGKPKLATDSHVTFRGADGSAEVSGDIMRFEESDEGMQVVVQTGKGKEGEQKVKLEDWISADGDGVATILSYIGDEQLPHSVTAEEANTLMQVYKHSGGNAKAVIQAFDVNYLAGYSGADQVGSVLDPALSKIAYENGKRDAEKDEAQRKQRASEYKALENPVAGWIGKVDGREQVKGLGEAKALEEAMQAMPESQRTAAEIMIETGKAVGLNVVLYDSDGKGAANDIQNGMFDAVTHTVFFDVSAWAGNEKRVQALKKEGTLGYAMLRVGGHELTHYLEVAAPEAYAKYSKAVKDALKAKGVDFAVRMREHIDKANAQGRKLTMGEAAAEVIADASEDMLQDSKLFNSLDTDTKSKIRAFLQNFAQKVKEIFQHLTGGHKESAALREMKNGVYHYLEGLQDLWDAGFDEILAKGTEEQSGGATEMVEGPEVKYSTRYVDNQPVVWVEENILGNKPDDVKTKTYIRDYLINNIDDVYTIIESGSKVYPAKKLPDEYLHSKYTDNIERFNRRAYRAKLKMVPGIGEMIEIATNRRWEPTKHTKNKDAKYGVYRYDTRIAFENGGKAEAYTAELVILNASDGRKYLYDVVNIQKDDVTASDLNEKARRRDNALQQTNAVNNSVPQSAANVNPDVKNSDRDTTDQTETEAFKRWFGDSKVVDEDGNPLIVYHGTDADFNTFDMSKGRANMDIQGAFFSPYIEDAQGYGGDVKAVYLSIKNPANESTAYRALNKFKGQNGAGVKAREYLISMGYDGVYNGYDEYIAFYPNQIKSATDNVGTFDTENPDIRYSDRDLPDGVTIREYLGSMKPTSSMTETEKLLLKRYQDQLRTLEEKEKLVEEQEEIIRTASFRNPDGSLNDEITKAKNRYKIYRDQANRAARALANAEKDEGFARLMATSRQVVNDYLLGAAGNVADAQDVLESEINELTRQLTKLEADVTRTSQGQRTAFARGLYNPDDLKAAAQKLKDTYGSRMSVQNIANRLALAYGELYANDGAEGARLFSAAAKDLATDLLAGNKFRYQSEILPMLREQIGTISLSDTDLQEIGNAGLTVTEYKRVLSPYIKVSAEGSDLSSYASNAEYYGNGALAAVLGDENEGNLAMRLYDVVNQEKAKEADNGYDGMSESQLIGMAMADIAGANLPMSANSSTVEYLRKELLKYAGENAEVAITVEEAISKAKKATAKAGRIWLEAAKNTETARQAVEYYRALDEKRRVMELAEQKKQITEQLKSDTAKKLQEKVTAQREEYREREKKAREYRKTRDEVDKLRRKISRNVKRLNTLRVRETDLKHVPQELQHVADAVMSAFTDSELGRLVFHEAKLMNLGRTYRLLRQSETDAAYFWDDEIETDIDNLQALGEAYGALRNREGNAPSRFSLEGVELETEILQGVDAIVSHVLNMIDATNTGFLYQRNETFTQFANKAGEKLRGHKDYKNLKGALGRIQHMLDENLRAGNTTPVYFFEHLENQEIMDVFDEIRKGMRQAAIIEREGKQFIEKAREQYNYGSWVADGKLTMKTGQGHTIELTREEAAEIYAIAKREAANKLYQTEHLLYGGFNYKHIDEKGKGLVRVKDESHQLDKADIAKISSWLTQEQKAYADALVGFLSTDMADYGNDASMKMYGYKKFTEQYYIPFHTVKNQLFQKGDEGPQGENAGTGRVKNSGFTHKVQYKANQALYVGGISETVADHIHKMAAYAAMVEPIENMKRLLNHKMLETDGTSNTIRALIGQKYGQASEDYMTQLLKDLNGATMGDKRASGLTDKMIGAFKRGAVMASASVVLQQPTAMTRAMAMISPKYFTNNPFYRPGKGTWEEMLEHSGTAVIKDMGKFDVGMGLTATQYILDEDLNVLEAYQRLKAESKTKAGKAAYDSFMAWLTAAPGKADQWTWGLIWKAVKAEQADLHPDMDQTSDAFLDMVGERFDDVIDHTQVYDSVLSRSNLMRSQDGIAKAITVFKSEPTLSLNMLYDALSGWKSKRHAGLHRGRIIGSVLASQILAGAMAALAQAWNDDDDKRTAIEKYADRATGNIVDNLNPLKMIPLVSDIVSMCEGYDVARPDMEIVGDVINYSKSFFDKAFDPDKALGWKDYENFLGTIANLVGIPAKNLLREGRRTWNAVVNTQWTAPTGIGVGQAILENMPFYGSKNKEYYQRIVTADLRGDVELAENLREYMLTSKMVTPDKLRSEIKTALKEAYIDGDTDDDTAIDMLVEIGAYEDREDAYWEVDKWKYMQETGASADSYSKYNDFYTAVETGKDLKKTIQVYLDNGASKSSLAGKITSQYKPQMIALKESGKGYADLQARILTAYEALGYDRQEKLKDIQKWFKTEGKK